MGEGPHTDRTLRPQHFPSAPRFKIAKPFLFAVTPHRLIAAEVPFEIGLLKS